MPTLQEQKMNRVSGDIIHKETGIGIPYVFTVELYDIDLTSQYDNPDADNSILATPGRPLRDETFMNTDPDSTKRQGLPGDRLVSGYNDQAGHFELMYSDEAFKIRKLKGGGRATEEFRPDLVLTLSKPEGLNMPEFSNVVFRSSWVRINAGREEYYRIELASAELQRANIPIPVAPALDEDQSEPEVPNTFENRLEKRVNEKLGIKGSIKTVYSKIFNQNRDYAIQRKDKYTQPFVQKISKIPAHLRNDAMHFVADGESVEEKTRKNLEHRVNEFYNKKDASPKQKGLVRLNDSDLEELGVTPGANGTVELSGDQAKVFEQKVKGSGEEASNLTDLIHQSPYALTCLEKNSEIATWEILCDEEQPGNPPEPAPSASRAKEEDIPIYIARQMNRSVSPEDPVRFSDSNTALQPSQRADQKIVEGSVSSLSLRQGPADTPAFYDFHHVQIAFEHVWQEAIDNRVIDLAERLYDKVVEVGGEITAENYPEEAKLGGKTNVYEQVPRHVAQVFKISAKVWTLCSLDTRESLEDWAQDVLQINEAINLLKRLLAFAGEDNIVNYNDDFRKLTRTIGKQSKLKGFTGYLDTTGGFPFRLDIKKVNKKVDSLKDEKANIMASAGNVLANVNEQISENEFYDNIPTIKDLNAHETLKALNKRLKEPYSFKYYAANAQERSINFGILVTYRQEWTPLAYQAGELVRTIPLAPKEVKKYTKKEVVKRKRSEKETENNLRVLKEDRSDTGRAESEIMNKAGNTSNYTSSAKGTYDVYLAKGEYDNTSSGTTSRDSQDQKKSFRESVVKAAQEYKNERKLEISTESSYESEITESGEISNPNDELTVTYLFYELQRRYRVNERIHRLRPVIFVAQEMPKPEEIDADWVLTHDWILQRVLLDDSFRPALNFITTSMVGAEVGIEQLRRNLMLQRQIVDRLQEQLVVLKDEVSRRYRTFEAAVDKEAGVSGGSGSSLDFIEKVDPTGVVDSVSSFLFGDDKAEAERLRARREAAMAAYDKAARDRDAMLAQLEREAGNLNNVTERYNQKISEYLNMKTQIERLFVHIKQNILHYMQAIWSYEPTDQRFFRLYNTAVVDIQGTIKYQMLTAPKGLDVTSPPLSYRGIGRLSRAYEYTAEPDMKIVTTTLEQMADLDNLLGFKGNYMIFPLKKSNRLTDYMMTPYIDNNLGLRDPDELGNLSLDEFSQYVCCLKKNYGADFEQYKEQLQAIYKKLLADPLRQGEIITVPTGSLFIEALPGVHPILEDFKLAHRAIDVKKVQAEVRKMEMENIRLAARLLQGELEDPDVEKRVVVEKNGADTNININE